jgi:hypothetical protein
MNKLGVGLIASVVALAGANAVAGTIGTIEGYSSGTAVTLDSNPVVTAVLSEPGTVNGLSYSSWEFLVNDGTGSLALYGTLPSGTTEPDPTVGDLVDAAGTFLPFDQIPEISSLTSLTSQGLGGVPGPIDVTIPQINLVPLPQNVAGYLVTLQNVTISGGSGNFGTANLNLTITDGSGDSMELFYWPGEFSQENANLFGTAIPNGQVDITGFLHVFGTNAQFSPFTITAVPEPPPVALVGVGLVAALALRRSKSQILGEDHGDAT